MGTVIKQIKEFTQGVIEDVINEHKVLIRKVNEGFDKILHSAVLSAEVLEKRIATQLFELNKNIANGVDGDSFRGNDRRFSINNERARKELLDKNLDDLLGNKVTVSELNSDFNVMKNIDINNSYSSRHLVKKEKYLELGDNIDYLRSLIERFQGTNTIATSKNTLVNVLDHPTKEENIELPEVEIQDLSNSESILIDKFQMSNHSDKTVFYKNSAKNCNFNNDIVALEKTTNTFDCNQCSYRSTHRPNLDRHFKAKHTNQRDLGCEQCDYASNRKDKLKQHIQRKH